MRNVPGDIENQPIGGEIVATGRTYGQFCPIAVGLDLIGDRWMLLICRELGLGDMRFTDLRRSLAGIAPNLLSERLRHLQAAGLVVSVELPPPAARSVYRLSDAGRDVLPVLRAAARFGASYLGDVPADVQFSARRAVSAFLLPWWRPDASRSPMLVRLHLAGPAAAVDDDLIDLALDGSVRLADPSPAEPSPADAARSTESLFVEVTLAQLVAARRPEGRFEADVRGSASSRARFFREFDLLPVSRRRASVARSGGR